MFGIGFTGKLKQTILLQDNSLKNLRDEINALQEKLNSKEIHVTHLAADNAVLKQRVVNLELLRLHYNDELDTFRKFGILIEQDDEGRITRISKEEKGVDLFKAKPLRLQDQPTIKTERIASRVVSEEAPPDWATSFQVATSPKGVNDIKEGDIVYDGKNLWKKTKKGFLDIDKSDNAIDSIRKNITRKRGSVVFNDEKAVVSKTVAKKLKKMPVCENPKKTEPKKKQSIKKKSK